MRSPELLIVAAAALFVILGRGRWAGILGDHAIWYSDLQGLLCGGRLMHEVRVPYGPVSLWLLWAVAGIFGPSISAIAGFLAICGLCAVLLLQTFAAEFLNGAERWFCAALLAGFVLWMPGAGNILYPYAFAVGPGLVFCLLSLWAQRTGLRRGQVLWTGLAGILAAIAFLTKQEIGGAAVAGVAALTFFFPDIRRRRRLLYLSVAGASFGVSAAGIVATTLDGESLMEVAGNNSLWPFVALPPPIRNLLWRMQGFDRLGTRFQSALDSLAVLVLIAIFLRLLFLGRSARLKSAAKLGVPLVLLVCYCGWRWFEGSHIRYLELSFPAILAAIGWGGLKARRETELRRVFATLAALAAGSLLLLYREGFQGLSQGIYSGLSFVLAIPVLTVLISGTLRALRRGTPAEQSGRLAFAIGIVAAALTAQFGWRRLAACRQDWELVVPFATQRGTGYLRPEVAPFYREAARIIREKTKEGDPILILPQSNALDFMLDRRNLSFFPNLVPGLLTPACEDQLISWWRDHPPRLILCAEGTLGVFRSGQLGDGFGMKMMRWIAENYRMTGVISPEGAVAARVYEPAASRGVPAQSR